MRWSHDVLTFVPSPVRMDPEIHANPSEAMLHFFGTIFVGIFAAQDWKISTFGWFFGLFNVIPVVIEVRHLSRED